MIIDRQNQPAGHKQEWEIRFDQEWYLYGADDHSRNIQQEIKSFIRALLNETEKAFGGCKKCYGKGYGTQTLYVHGSADFIGDKDFTEKAPTMVFCTCERGRHLESLLNK